MDAVFLQGDRVRLSPLDPAADHSAYVSWLNDQETTRYMGSGRFPMTQSLVRAYIESFEGRSDGFLLGIFDCQAGQHVGNVTLQSIDWRDRRGEIGILIGDRTARGKGFGGAAVSLVVDHAFLRLGLNKLTAGYVTGNDASARLFGALGFVEEGVLKEHFYLDGEFLDCPRLALLRSKWLEAR